jgi:DNA-binding NarL/FixJ family response regulator
MRPARHRRADRTPSRTSTFSLGGVEFGVFSVAVEPPGLPDHLSDAERKVALAALAGLSNAAIARRRGTSPRTVANQLAALYRKLGVRSRTELAARMAQSRSAAD